MMGTKRSCTHQNTFQVPTRTDSEPGKPEPPEGESQGKPGNTTWAPGEGPEPSKWAVIWMAG